MAENEQNFWENKQDDFWNKPVMDDNWLKEEPNPYVQDFPHVQDEELQRAWPIEEAEGDGEQNAPYMQYWQGEAQPEKSRHIHTIICLIFMAAAVLSVICTALLVTVQKRTTTRKVRQGNYIETAEADELGYMKFYDNGVVFLEDEAYTVYDAGTYPINPENKLIAIHMEAFSEKYESGHYSMNQCYVGYDTPYGRQYSKTANMDSLVPYIVKHGYSPEQMLYTMGIANGDNEEGYYFFYVPQEVTELKLYSEKQEQDNGVSWTERIYTKSYVIRPADKGNPKIQAD